MKQLWFSSIAIASLCAACGSSKTTEQINRFADKVCDCKDASCATAVEAEYLSWWQDNQRARGSEGDRKDVEKAMERYAVCHNQLVGPEPVTTPTTVPTVDLDPPAPPPAMAPAPGAAAPEEIVPNMPKNDSEGDSAAAKDDPPTP